jgi:hypothetical protein
MVQSVSSGVRTGKLLLWFAVSAQVLGCLLMKFHPRVPMVHSLQISGWLEWILVWPARWPGGHRSKKYMIPA